MESAVHLILMMIGWRTTADFVPWLLQVSKLDPFSEAPVQEQLLSLYDDVDFDAPRLPPFLAFDSSTMLPTYSPGLL